MLGESHFFEKHPYRHILQCNNNAFLILSRKDQSARQGHAHVKFGASWMRKTLGLLLAGKILPVTAFAVSMFRVGPGCFERLDRSGKYDGMFHPNSFILQIVT